VRKGIRTYNNYNLKSSESGEYRLLKEDINRLNQEKNKKLKKILIIGESLKRIFPQLYGISPGAQYFIGNKSKDVLESFKKYHKNHKNYSTYILDVSKGASLHDFIFYNGKVDLIIANKVYSQLSRKKRRLSIKFLYKHYLCQYGVLCIIEKAKSNTKCEYNFKRNIKPVLVKEIQIKNERSVIRLIFYMKKKGGPNP
jgi:hypothetical protein